MSEATEQVTAEPASRRYVYCLVDTSGRSTLDVEPDGLEGRPLSLVDCGGVGAVVHGCESQYDTADEDQVRRWLLAHQAVVDAASDAFGTPLPVRFDTVLDGGDATVRDWLSTRAGTVREHLERLRGCSEYRVTLEWDSEPFRTELATTDDELRALEHLTARAAPGKTFMLEKQYASRYSELVREREAELRSLLSEQLAPAVVDTADQDATEPDGEDGRRVVAKLSVLAESTNETALGENLDAVAAERGVRVRFTGPWPPYTFAPELG